MSNHVRNLHLKDNKEFSKKGILVEVSNRRRESNGGTHHRDMEEAIHALRKLVSRERVIGDLKKHDFYLSKGQRRRLKRQESVKRNRLIQKKILESTPQ